MTGIMMSLMNNVVQGIPDPVLYLDAEDYSGSGTTWQSSVGPDATLVNAPVYVSAAPTYFDFDGVNQYAEFLHDSVLKPTAAITMEQWISADDWSAGDSVNYLASLSCTQGGGYAHYIWSGTWRSYVRVGASYQIPTADVSGFADYSYHHLVTTFDGRYTRLYVDGVLTDTEDLGTSGNVIGYDADNSILIGAEATGTTGAAGQYWRGKVGLTRIWNRALTDAQVTEIYAENSERFANIVATNLQLYLTAADPSSYPGTGTTWTDLSANGYTTTLSGAPAFNSTYFTFDGTTEYVDTNQSLGAESFSVGAWFRTTASGINMILSKETTAGWPWNYRIWLNSGQIIGDIAQSGGTNNAINSSGPTYNDGSWHLVMFTRNDSTLTLYVDGSQIASQGDTLTGTIVNAQELWIGRSAFTAGGTRPTGSYQYTGDIGQIFIYDAVLTPTQVLQNYDATRATYGL
jgi:hypothetical protein